MKCFLFFLMIFSICCKTKISTSTPQEFVGTKAIVYNNISVNLVINKPALSEVDVLIVFHGTVLYDSLILNAANTTLSNFKSILNRTDMMLVSVAYPEENLLMGDNLKECEAALLWVKNKAAESLNVRVKKIFLAGHSQGGYLATRLNTIYETNGVVANGPGPLNLVFRCQLEENGNLPNGVTCTLLKNSFDLTSVNPNAYAQRSLLNFTNGFKADMLFVQGMDDTPIQMQSWPTFKQAVTNCTNCRNIQFLELAGFGHTALFSSLAAKTAFNTFINNR